MSHVAFLVEPSYGHVVPTMSLVAELTRNACRVTYPTTAHFADRVQTTSGAEVIVYRPLEGRVAVWREAKQPDGSFSLDGERLREFVRKTARQQNLDTIAQLSERYGDDPPHLIVHDQWLNFAATTLAQQWGISRVLFVPQMPVTREVDCSLALVSLPRFFHKEADTFGEKFFYMGFPSGGRKAFFKPWRWSRQGERLILVSSTTGLLPQIEFFRSVIPALEGRPHRVVLSIGRDIDPAELGHLPSNFELNTQAANFEILEHADLFIGQAGQGVSLEALYCGVPQLAIPPGPTHKQIADRVVELGLGCSLPIPESTPENIGARVDAMLNDAEMRARLKDVQSRMKSDDVARAAELVMRLL